MPKPLLYSRPLPDYLLALLGQKVPAYGMPLVARLVRSYDFAFRFAPPRLRKLGDYTRKANGEVAITINADLPPELFLVTFLHEVAHLEALQNRTRREAPHGKRWQACFGALLTELCQSAEAAMPAPLHQALVRHSQAPTATLTADPALARLLLPAKPPRQALADGFAHVEMLAAGTAFAYRGKAFLLSGKMRTRHYGTDLQTGQLWKFSAQCTVQILPEVPQPQSQATILVGHQLEPGQEFVHRRRKMRLESKQRTRLHCTDLQTGRRIELPCLVHVGV